MDYWVASRRHPAGVWIDFINCQDLMINFFPEENGGKIEGIADGL
jgi:hypothetical protein